MNGLKESKIAESGSMDALILPITVCSEFPQENPLFLPPLQSQSTNKLGHAGAMLQARQLGKELYVGVHTDEDILYNKGPVVMKLDERITAVQACKWCTKAIEGAPYVTDPKYMAQHGCKYVVHGDDITTDANGEDCYQEVKDLGLFVVVKRTPNISTTELVGRMLLMSKNHHYNSIKSLATVESHPLFAEEGHMERFIQYASDATGLSKGSGVYVNVDGESSLKTIVDPSDDIRAKLNSNIVYVDGGFDLFHPGHIEALKVVRKEADKRNAAVVVGLHDDRVINQYKGLNYPIMNQFERALCVLQCRYVDVVVIGAPYIPTTELFGKFKGTVSAVFHGPTQIDEGVYDNVQTLFKEIGPHKYDNMNTEFIVNRVLSNKAAYEERQRRKGWKAEVEQKLRAEELQNGR